MNDLKNRVCSVCSVALADNEFCVDHPYSPTLALVQHLKARVEALEARLDKSQPMSPGDERLYELATLKAKHEALGAGYRNLVAKLDAQQDKYGVSVSELRERFEDLGKAHRETVDREIKQAERIAELEKLATTITTNDEATRNLIVDSEFLHKLLDALDKVLPDDRGNDPETGDRIPRTVNGIVAAVQHWKDIAGASLTAVNTRIHQLQAMRACVIYARDRRGPAFDFDTWSEMVAAALDKGDVPPHALENAQAVIFSLQETLTKVRSQRNDLEKELAKKRPLSRVQTQHLHMEGNQHDDMTRVDRGDTLERIYCFRAGQLGHHGCGWCKEHDRPPFECLCNGVRVTARMDLPLPHCEYHPCKSPVVHGEHWHDKMRWWCDDHVPMSGHYEHCPKPCRDLVKSVTRSDLFSDLAARHEHLRKP